MTNTEKKKFNTELTKLNRLQLGIIDLSFAKDIDILEGSERQSYLERAEAAYSNSVLRNEINYLIQKQLEFLGQHAIGEEEIYVGRGTISGLSLVLERLESLHSMFAGEREERSDDSDGVIEEE